MRPQERDDLLIRIDERTNNIWNVTEKQEKHLKNLNGKVAEAIIKAAENTKDIEGNRRSINLVWKVLIATGVISGLGGGTAGVIRLISG